MYPMFESTVIVPSFAPQDCSSVERISRSASAVSHTPPQRASQIVKGSDVSEQVRVLSYDTTTRYVHGARSVNVPVVFLVTYCVPK